MNDDLLADFIKHYLQGDPHQAADYFNHQQPDLEVPILGHVVGMEAFNNIQQQRKLWLQAGGGEINFIARTVSPERIVEETEIIFSEFGKPIVLPLIVIGDLYNNKFTQIRTYYSWSILEQTEAYRPAFLVEDPNIALPLVIQRYHQAYRQSDLSLMIKQFASDATVSTLGRCYKGHEAIGDLYHSILASGSNEWQYCTVTDNGKRCVIEYNLVMHGGEHLATSQAAIAAFDYLSTDYIHAIRYYGDDMMIN